MALAEAIALAEAMALAETEVILEVLDSSARPPGFRGNLNTEHLGIPNPSLRIGGPDLRAAYTFARGVARMQADVLGGRPGHRFVWVRGGAFGSNTMLAHPDSFVIVGRHTQCGIVLDHDPNASLRHLIIRSIALPSGGLALRILDLHTDLGFVLPDGTRQTSIFAEGPVAIAIGEYALVALPTETKDDQLPGELPKPEVETPSAVRDQIAAMEQAMSPYRANARPLLRSSRITLMPRLVMVGEALPPRLGRLASGGTRAITLGRQGRTATVTVSEEDLGGGVLIGRSEKCHAENLRRITDNNTSRVHVLILREADQYVAYDLASTQGTFFNNMPARRVVLGDASSLMLGRGEQAVRLHWHRA